MWGFSRDDVEASFFTAYLEKGIFGVSPFETIDKDGVGALVRSAVEAGRATRPDLKLGVCGEHGGDPESVHFFHEVGPRLRLLLAVPDPGRPAGGGPRGRRVEGQRQPLSTGRSAPDTTPDTAGGSHGPSSVLRRSRITRKRRHPVRGCRRFVNLKGEP